MARECRGARLPLERDVEVRALEQEVAGEVLLGLGERTISYERLAAALPHGRRQIRRLQLAGRK